MAAYRREVDAIVGHFKGYQVEHIDRRKNEASDAISRLGSQRKLVPPNTFLDILLNPSIKLPTEADLLFLIRRHSWWLLYTSCRIGRFHIWHI